jgi:hypothetical protein
MALVMRTPIFFLLTCVAGCGGSVGSDGGIDASVQPDAEDGASEASDAQGSDGNAGGDVAVNPDAGCSDGGAVTFFGCWDGQCRKETEFCYSAGSAVGSCEPIPCACEPTPSCGCLVAQLTSFCKDAGTPICAGTAMGGLIVTCP